MEGITQPLLWRTSPNKNEIAIVASCDNNEQSLTQLYLERLPHVAPSVAEICSLGIKILEVLERIHAKKVRHGNLRPDVIGCWLTNGEPQVCIRDFTESRLLVETGSPINATPESRGSNFQFDISPGICVHYMAPELFNGTQPGLSFVCVNEQ
jgi:hypothetical protein